MTGTRRTGFWQGDVFDWYGHSLPFAFRFSPFAFRFSPFACRLTAANAIHDCYDLFTIRAIPLLFAFADRFTVGFFTSTFPLFLRNLYDLPPPRIGTLIAVFMLPFAALSFPFGVISQRSSRALLLCGGSFVYGCLVSSLGFWPVEALLGVMIATGTAAAVMFVPSMLFTVEATPESVRTTSLGAFNAAGSLGFIVGPVTGGLVSQTVAASYGWESGYAAAFAVAGGCEILLALGSFHIVRRFERERRPPAS
jgi:MFS family permease